MTQSVLITGATGYLGTHVANYFDNNDYSVHFLTRSSSIRPGNLTSAAVEHVVEANFSNMRNIVERAAPNVVVHMASISRGVETASSIDQQIDANIRLPSHLLMAMRDVGVKRFVNCGTSWQNSSGDEYSPFNFYAATKQSCEDIVENFCASGLKVASLRLFDTYGPQDSRGKIIDLIFDCAASGRRLDMSPGQQLIDLVHVSDVASAFFMAASLTLDFQPGEHRVYGVSSEDRRSLRKVAELIGEIAGKPALIEWGKRPYRDREIMEPWTSFQRIPGWRPLITLEAGLQSVWRER